MYFLITKTYPVATLIILALLGACTNNATHNVAKPMVLWSKSDTSDNNFRIPAIIVTKKNTVLAFAEGREGGDSGDIDILLKRSFDNGQTWENQIIVWDDRKNTCGNPCPVIDQTNGRIFLFMTWNLGTDSEDKIIKKESTDTRHPYMSYSDDDGVTWSKPVNLTTTCKNPSWGWYATGPGVGIQLQSPKYKNRLVIPCNNSYDTENETEAVREGHGYGAHVLLSDDGGLNWRISEIITPGCNESQVMETNDGVLIMNMRSYNRKNCRAISRSDDGGETWSEIEHDPQLVESVCQAGLFKYGSFGDETLLLFSNPASPFNRTHMTMKTSFDDGASWSNAKLIYEGPSAYSSITKLPNGNIGLFFEAGDKNPYEKMVFLSFKPVALFTSGPLMKQSL